MIYKNKAFRITMNVIMVLLTLCCILPFILLIASSFSSEADLTKYGYSFIPRGFTLAAYKYIWAIKENILRAYGMSFLITGIGTVINLVMTLLFAYPLSYLLMNAFYVIMMRTYIMTNVPMEVIEASMIDGANEFQNLARIVVPMSKPIIGTIGLMSAIAYWNNWTNGIYFIQSRRNLYGIQNYLNSVISNVAFLQTHSVGSGIVTADLPSISIRMALAVIAIIPVLVAYPFFQKSFVAGITVGSVKG